MKNYLTTTATVVAGVILGAAITADGRPADPRHPLVQQGVMSCRHDIRQCASAFSFPERVSSRSDATAEADIPDLCGSVVYSADFTSSDPAVGLYRLPKTAGESFELMFTGPDAQGGGVYVDGRYYSTYCLNLMNYYIVTVSEWDVPTGTKTMEYDGDVTNVSTAGSAVDPLTGDIYGIFLNQDANGYVFGKISYTPQPVTTAIAPLPGSWNAMAIDRDGRIYGIDLEADYDASTGAYTVTAAYLNTIDRNTGKPTRVGVTGELPQYTSGACIDPVTNRMFWNVNRLDNTSSLCEVDLATGRATLLYDMPHGEVVMGMYAPRDRAEAKAPGECSYVAGAFDGGSLSGKVSFKTPARLFDGSAATGDLTVKVIANGKEVASRTAAYGEALDLPVEVSAAGLYDITVYASNAAGYGPMTCVKGIYAGNDTPAPTTATLTAKGNEMTLGWEPVGSSVNGGYVDYSRVTYRVTRFPGRTVVADDLADTKFTEILPEPEAITSYHYSVVAKYEGRESAPALSNSVVLGALIPPYSSTFGGSDMADWTIDDSNLDGFTWMPTGDGAMMISYNSEDNTAAMDDWLISPPLKLEAGKSYQLSFAAFAKSASYPEKIEVKYGAGSAPGNMTHTVVAPAEIRALAEAPEYLEATIEPEADGNYCIGFHAISAANSYYLYVSRVIVEAGVSTDAPGEVADLVVTPDADGSLSASISFKAPSLTIAGKPLASISRIQISRDEEVIKTFEGVTQGQSLEYTDNVDRAGEYTYAVTAFNEAGEGLRATATTFIGVDLPGIVYNVKIARTATEGEVSLEWDAVAEDHVGRPVNTSNVTYSVYDYSNPQEFRLVKRGIKSTSHTFMAVAAGEQDFVQYVVAAETVSGIGKGSPSPMIAVGKPYAGLHESFADGLTSYRWSMESVIGGDVRLYKDTTFPNIASQDSDNGYVGVFAAEEGTGASLVSGLVSLAGGTDPYFSIWTYNLGGGADRDNIVKVDVMPAEHSRWTNVYAGTVSSIAGGSPGWVNLTLPLAEYAGSTLQVRVTALSTDESYTLFDNIVLGSSLGVEDVDAGYSDADAEYYNLQGMKVDNPGRGIYIRRAGSRVDKVLR